MDGKALKALREKAGLGQAEFALLLGIVPNHLYKLEHGVPDPKGKPLMPSKTLARLAVLLTEKKNRDKIMPMVFTP